MAKGSIYITAEDYKRARLYWGNMPLPAGGRIVGLLSRPDGQQGAAIRMEGGQVWQGNAGTLRSTGCKV